MDILWGHVLFHFFIDSHIAKRVVTKVRFFDSEYLENETVMVWFSHQIRKNHSQFC